MRIATFQVVLVFKQDDEIIFSIGDKLKALQAELKAKLQLLNIPQGAPPEAPRVILYSPLVSINIGLNRLDIVVNVPTQIQNNRDSSFGLLGELIDQIHNALIKDTLVYDWCGLILNTEFPSKKDVKPSLKIIESLFADLVKIDHSPNDLAAFQLQYGFKENGFYRNVTISGYDTYDIQIPENMLNQAIDLSKVTVRESGITIVLDINNKPTEPRVDFLNDIKLVQNEVIKSIDKVLYESNLIGRIE